MSYKDRRRILWVMFLIGLALIAIVAQATTLARLHFQDLVRYSYSIARARCVRSRTMMENGEIWTDITFRVLWQQKGYLPGEIVVRQPGGKFLHLHSHVEGTPQFHPNEEVYLFLAGHPGRQFVIVGWTQGTFRIHRDPTTNVETVTQDSAETPVFDPATETFTRGGTRNLPSEIFEQRIRRETFRQAEVNPNAR
ncbi:MAG TPA: hypothetical protein VL128_07420 [Candidatus Eisenbacteria bacterium]|nr:hypothetical protein [Candidatus Eisenbacteria bacterium]